SEAPELRWYAPWLGAAAASLDALLGGAGGGANVPFAAFSAPSQYFIVLLEVFAIMVFACAVAAEYLATIFGRLDAQTWTARAASRAARAPIRAAGDQRYDGGLLREGRARRRRVRHPRGRRSGARSGSQPAGARALWRGQSRRRGVEPAAPGQPGRTLVGSRL